MNELQVPQPQQGTVVRIVADKGFLFIRGSDGVDYFGHRSALQDGLRMEDLHESTPVTFTPDPKYPRGPRAEDIRRVASDQRRRSTDVVVGGMYDPTDGMYDE